MAYKVLVDSTRWLPKGGGGAPKMAAGERLDPADYETANAGDVIDPAPAQLLWLHLNGHIVGEAEADRAVLAGLETAYWQRVDAAAAAAVPAPVAEPVGA